MGSFKNKKTHSSKKEQWGSNITWLLHPVTWKINAWNDLIKTPVSQKKEQNGHNDRLPFTKNPGGK
jgi:hypothetical protein